MRIVEHFSISTVVFWNPVGILSGIIPDLFFYPIDIYDWYRRRKRLPFKELDNCLVKINWFCHTIWILIILFPICWLTGTMIFWQGYFLHIVLDLPTHDEKRALKLFYPISSRKFKIQIKK